MKLVDTVRRALIAAGYARTDIQHSEDVRACATVIVERWQHFGRIDEDRAPMVLWHRQITGTDIEEIDVFGALAPHATDVQALVRAITDRGDITYRKAANA